MKSALRIMLIVVFCLSIAGWAYAGDSPIWDIFVNGKVVKWVDWRDNKRFAIYNAGTPYDPSDDMVLDKETGLVWERLPGADTDLDGKLDPTARVVWLNALHYCRELKVGNRKGWRLPTIEELLSLVDPSVVEPGPTLPSGHPFIDVQTDPDWEYWSATTTAAFPGDAWSVNFRQGHTDDDEKTSLLYLWCVRGGPGVNPQ